MTDSLILFLLGITWLLWWLYTDSVVNGGSS